MGFDVETARAHRKEREAELSVRREEIAQLVREAYQLEPDTTILVLGYGNLPLDVAERLAGAAGNEAIERGDVAHQDGAGCPCKLCRLVAWGHRILHRVVGTTDGRGGPAAGEVPCRRCPPKGGA